MLPMLLLVIWSYLSALHARTIVVCVSVSFVPVSPFNLYPVGCLHSSSSVFYTYFSFFNHPISAVSIVPPWVDIHTHTQTDTQTGSILTSLYE